MDQAMEGAKARADRAGRARPFRRLSVIGLAPGIVAVVLAGAGCSALTGVGGTPTGAPSISSVSPGYGPQSGGGQVTIHGSGFTGAKLVHFGSAGSASFSVVSDSQIVATVPASSSASGVQITVSNSSGTSPSNCVLYIAGCSGGYFYMSATPWNFSAPVNIQNVAVPVPGVSGASVLVSATGGTVSVNGELDSSTNTFVPTAFVANGTISVSNVTVTLKGQLSGTMEIPLPLGLPYGLDVYVTITPAVSAVIPVTLFVNASWTFSGGFVNGGITSMTSTLTCQGVTINSILSAFPTCINASATVPSLNGAQASLTVSPLWLQVGPPGLDVGFGPKVGLSAGIDTGGASFWEICAALSWQLQAAILNQGGNILGPVTLAQSSAGNPNAHCSLGAVG